ncbi:CDP-alcohol phosphatidyltransferase family protein [Aeromicrobium sp. YIM 150415]|uniref:phosphatidylinositol phosphate synthase n=1 Tax=Aeromicrobium sp. YIM 150415 TaxID=2803912 RepID=UPI0019640E85|nr:CDP-alcohol phosphatidyltransferase family protein [Aeromicrobium sp. YIM 150415]MBM9464962.1 CDP-alcohol phosphatidyltransferase family protein [Aeromicrobium sp. YIM 150415]
MLERFRAFWNKLLSPIADGLIKIGVTPDMVTWVGTIGVCVGALWLFPQGEFFWGTMFVTAFVFSDIVDGSMARKLGRSSKWGAFLDSSLDRVGDAAIFGGIALWYAWEGDSPLYLCLSLACLVLGMMTSYLRARAEGLGLEAKGGIAERSDRLVAILVMTGFAGLLDLPILQHVTLWALAVASLVTCGQRMLMVRRQSLT